MRSCFPRSIERGLIEAVGPWIKIGLAPFAFRVQLNAASLKQHGYPLPGTTAAPFRVQLNAASLKPLIKLFTMRSRRCFPRSIERGLIEATGLIACAEQQATFPRSIERGLIEARSRHDSGVRSTALSAFN